MEQRIFKKVFSNIVLFNYIYSFVPIIYQDERVVSYRFKELPSINICRLDSSSSAKQIQLFQVKLKHDKDFVVYFKKLPAILRSSWIDLNTVKTLLKRFPHYFHNSLVPSAKEERNNDKTYRSKSWILDCLSISGNLECLQYIIEQCPWIGGITPNTVDMACESGHLHIVRYLLSSFKGIGPSHAGFEGAALNGHLPVIQHLLATTNIKFTHQAVMSAAKSGVVDLVRLLLKEIKRAEKGSGLSLDQFLMAAAIQGGSPNVVKLVFDHLGRDCLNNSCYFLMDIAAEIGDLEIVKFLESKKLVTPSVREKPTRLSLPAARGHYDVVEYLHRKKLSMLTPGDLQEACKHNQMAIVKYIVDKEPSGISVMCDTALGLAAESGHLTVCQYLFEKGLVRQCKSETLVAVCEAGHFEVAKFLVDNKFCASVNPTESATVTETMDKCLKANAKVGNLDMFQYLVKSFNLLTVEFDTMKYSSFTINPVELRHHQGSMLILKCMHVAAEHSHINLVKWMVAHYTIPLSKVRLLLTIVAEVASSELLDMFYQDDADTTIDSILPILQAASNHDNVTCYQYFLAKGVPKQLFKCPLLMDKAIEKGAIKIVRWLHLNIIGVVGGGDNTIATCSSQSVDMAAINGHLGVIQYLQRHGIHSGFSSSTATVALMYGHYELVHFLLNNRTEGYISQGRCLVVACSSNHLEIIEYLHTHHGPLPITSSLFKHDHEDIYRFLIQNYYAIITKQLNISDLGQRQAFFLTILKQHEQMLENLNNANNTTFSKLAKIIFKSK
ncbi:multiple ankyrin repeats single kh domain protein [Cavenderia fasciculata]|uniref:Multiple ankyrin repeats single kh domain protein n=1 Tax=Cavenderia fasciculata TaxID=261658 RepID=F4PRA3_CACFS|nr:multiple ankyrin repeats single kh domain protein [Cavenderia fasciculata]EGG21303.1 multiple ankyrin repeats single kh domain protein [Cavenderia fasciculata]|eukprot:XP_004359153.1 multiple ankyrin repeats single kh domain protein [Cavenderia fasciculata]